MAGDICAAVGLKNLVTGDTICTDKHPIVLESIDFPKPVIEVAVEPKTKADQEKMGMALAKLAQEDPTFKVHTDIGPDHHRRHGRAAPRDHRRPHDARVQGRSQRRQAPGELPRDDPRERRGRRQVHSPDRRLGQLRPRQDSHLAERARQGLRVLERHQGRHDSQGVHQADRPGHSGSHAARRSSPATRWSTSRFRSTTAATTTSTRTKWRSRSPVRWPSRKPPAKPSRFCWSR